MTAQLNVGKVQAVAGRREPFDWAAFQKDGVTGLTIDASDDVLFKLSAIAGGVIGATPTIDVSNDDPTSGSHVTIAAIAPASGQVILDGADTEALFGRYAFELNLKDASDSDKLKPICRGTIEFLKGHGGEGVP